MNGVSPGITAFVVCHNEEAGLRACLPTLAFCREVVVVDKGSADGGAAVAEASGARVFRRPPDPPFVEATRAELAAEAACDWVLFVDPDETVPVALAEDIARTLERNPHAGLIGLPFRYHFRGHPLHHGFWGRDDFHMPRLVHRRRVRLLPRIHRGVELLPGFESVRIPGTETNRIRHAWADSYAEVLAKHRRHLACEDLARGPSLRAGLLGFLHSYVACAGWRDGAMGLVLSLLYAHYAFRIGARLRR